MLACGLHVLASESTVLDKLVHNFKSCCKIIMEFLIIVYCFYCAHGHFNFLKYYIETDNPYQLMRGVGRKKKEEKRKRMRDQPLVFLITMLIISDSREVGVLLKFS